MKISNIEHIGFAVKSLEETIPFYENILGLKCYNIEEIKDQKIRTAFFHVGKSKIELMESTDPEGPLGKFIKKNGEGIHHVAFAVKNIENKLREASLKGIRLIDQTSRKGSEGFNIAFLHPESTFGVLMEFCEKKA
jgi:methylmalonyl-CoA/ethylmalonyl-CoA epimerase